jgi:hypothetical protein
VLAFERDGERYETTRQEMPTILIYSGQAFFLLHLLKQRSVRFLAYIEN